MFHFKWLRYQRTDPHFTESVASHNMQDHTSDLKHLPKVDSGALLDLHLGSVGKPSCYYKVFKL